jgi:hypothetical protein
MTLHHSTRLCPPNKYIAYYCGIYLYFLVALSDCVLSSSYPIVYMLTVSIPV